MTENKNVEFTLMHIANLHIGVIRHKKKSHKLWVWLKAYLHIICLPTSQNKRYLRAL